MSDTVAAFTALHVPGDPLVLYNVWDAGSARAVSEAGARAIATASHSAAEANGYKDGETLPLELVLANLERVMTATDLPVTLDFESGYGATPAAVAAAVAKVAALGAAGINLEDWLPQASGVQPVDVASARVAAAAQTGIHVNARTDIYRGVKAEAYSPQHIDRVIERAAAFAAAGARSLFVPFLGDHPTIAAICAASPLPVNVMWAPGRGSPAELGALGVARISYGPWPWLGAMDWLKQQAQALYSAG